MSEEEDSTVDGPRSSTLMIEDTDDPGTQETHSNGTVHVAFSERDIESLERLLHVLRGDSELATGREELASLLDSSTTSRRVNHVRFQQANQRIKSSFDASQHEDDDQHDDDNTFRDDTSASATKSNKKPYRGVFAKTPSRFASAIYLDDEKLPTDTHSFLMSASITSLPFVTALLVFAAKVAMSVLIVINLLNVTQFNMDNPLGVPGQVSGSVVVAQFFALFVAVLTQGDLLTSVKLFYQGYTPSIRDAFDELSCFRWMCALLSMFLEGVFALVVTWMLIVTTEEVVPLLLNFTAVEFIALLDTAVFHVAKSGYLGVSNQKQTEHVLATSYKVPRGLRWGRTFRFVLLLLMYLSLVIGWAVIFDQQSRGKYMASTVMAQFGDNQLETLGTYSGLYTRDQGSLWGAHFGRRPRYVEERGSGAYFEYCTKWEAWTFHINGTETDPCKQVVARSVTHTKTFELTDTASTEWAVTSDGSRFFPMHHFILGYACQGDGQCGPVGAGYCNHKNRCVCKEPFYGIRCDYNSDETCGQVVVNDAKRIFQGTRTFATGFDLLRNKTNQRGIRVYDRPMFFRKSPSGDSFDLVFFTGLRWVLSFSNEISNTTDGIGIANRTESGLVDYFSRQDFHAKNLFKNSEFLSEMVAFSFPRDTEIPEGKSWLQYRTEASDRDDLVTFPITVSLRCGVCNNSTNKCLNDNVCNATNVCQCSHGESGSLCQTLPIGDAQCNDFFNEPIHNYDGGDCCQSTCVDTETHMCARNTIGDLDDVIVKFPSCLREADECEKKNCWIDGTHDVDDITGEGTGHHVLLSENGDMVLLGAPSLQIVRVYHRRGSRWVQRGRILEGDPNSKYGAVMALDVPRAIIFNRRFGLLPIAIALGFQTRTATGFRVYYWEPTASGWAKVGDDVPVCTSACQLDALSLTRDGLKFTVAASHSKGAVKVYQISTSEPSDQWVEVGSELSGVSAAALTLNGMQLVVAKRESPQIEIFDIFNRNSSLSVDLDSRIKAVHLMQVSKDGDLVSLVVDLGDHFGIVAVKKNTSGTVLWSQHNLTEIHEQFIEGRIALGARAVSILSNHSLSSILSNHSLSTYSLSDTSWETVDPPYPLTRPDSMADASVVQRIDFSPSADGRSLAIIDDASLRNSYIRVASLTSEVCDASKVELSLSLTLDENPKVLDWVLERVVVVGDAVIPVEQFRACHGCYKSDDFIRANVVETTCVDASEIQCTRLRFPCGALSTEGTRYAAFQRLQNGTTITIGSSDTPSTLSPPLSQLKGSCSQERSLTCPAGESVFAVALTTGPSGLIEAKWTLKSPSGWTFENSNESMSGGLYDVCVPASEALTFKIQYLRMENRPSGINLYLDWKEIPTTHSRYSELETIPIRTNESFVNVTLMLDQELTSNVTRSWSIKSGDDVLFESVSNSENIHYPRQSYLLATNRTYSLIVNQTDKVDVGYIMYVGGLYADIMQVIQDPDHVLVDASNFGTSHTFTLPLGKY